MQKYKLFSRNKHYLSSNQTQGFTSDPKVLLVIDKDLFTSSEFFGCHPCVNTATIKLNLQEFVEKFVPMTGHNYTIVTLSTE